MRTPAHRTLHRCAMGMAFAGLLVLIWLSLGVGIIGQDGDRANAMYFGVVAVGVVGALVTRLRPSGMARTLTAMALAQALVTAIALIAGLGQPWSGPAELLALNGFFIGVFLASAWMFRRAVVEA